MEPGNSIFSLPTTPLFSDIVVIFIMFINIFLYILCLYICFIQVFQKTKKINF